MDQIKPYVAAVPKMTTFEISTALAFWYFAKKEIDIAVIEVGLGGLLDATNVITPRVSVITSLYLEHNLILGETLTKIAAEKGGIIKSKVPVVLAEQREPARKKIAEIAANKESQLIEVGKDYLFKPGLASLDGQSFYVRSKDSENWCEISIGLLGPHQIENAVVAYSTLIELDKVGISMKMESIKNGFASAKWPARFEVLQRDPPVIVDSAHTPDAVQKLLETLDQFFPHKQVTLVFGVSEDKDIQGMLNILAHRAEHIICTKSTHPRSMDPDELLLRVLPFRDNAKAIENPRDALEKALTLIGSKGLILITGSIFIAASGRIAWFEIDAS